MIITRHLDQKAKLHTHWNDCHLISNSDADECDMHLVAVLIRHSCWAQSCLWSAPSQRMRWIEDKRRRATISNTHRTHQIMVMMATNSYVCCTWFAEITRIIYIRHPYIIAQRHDNMNYDGRRVKLNGAQFQKLDAIKKEERNVHTESKIKSERKNSSDSFERRIGIAQSEHARQQRRRRRRWHTTSETIFRLWNCSVDRRSILCARIYNFFNLSHVIFVYAHAISTIYIIFIIISLICVWLNVHMSSLIVSTMPPMGKHFAWATRCAPY